MKKRGGLSKNPESRAKQLAALKRGSEMRKANFIRVIDGVQHKLCRGPLHEAGGALLPLQSFWTIKRGPRAGKPFSRCVECERVVRGRDPKTSGVIEISRVWWIFVELQRRLGKAEACRRIGVSYNFWMRVEREIYLRMRRETARRAIAALYEARANNEVRHKDSIRYGAYLRGRKEKIPTHRSHFYKTHGDSDNERRRKR